MKQLQCDLRSNTERPLEDIFVIYPGAVIDYKKKIHKSTISLQVWANPVIVAMLIAKQDHSYMWYSTGLHQSLNMLQPACGVRDFLLFAAIQNHNKTVHIQWDMTLDNCWTCVETINKTTYVYFYYRFLIWVVCVVD